MAVFFPVLLSGIGVGLESAVYTAVIIGAAVYGAFLLGAGSVSLALSVVAAARPRPPSTCRAARAPADGRVLPADAGSPLPLPQFTNSAVDGYAISSRDLPQDKEQAFALSGRVQAGASAAAPPVSLAAGVSAPPALAAAAFAAAAPQAEIPASASEPGATA